MTKYKEYLRTKGIKLECDYEFLPCNYVEAVETEVMDDCVVAVVYSNCAGAEYAVFNRYGECDYYDSDAYHAYVEDPHCDPEFTSWMCNTDCKISSTLFTVAVGMYGNDAKVRVAFKHMRAGIMDEGVFRKWHVEHCLEYVGIL